MANRLYNQFRYNLEHVVVSLFLHATIGASGAVTLDAAQSRGIKSIVHGGNGTYTINLQDNYNRLLNVSVTHVSSAALAAPDVRVYDDSVVNSTAPSLTLVFSSGGTDTNPASGEQIRAEIVLKNTNV